MTSAPITIVTCSYGPDASRCRRLCRSIDRFVPATIEHCIIVPRRDYPLFRDLHSGRRRVHVTEEVVPGKFRHLPTARKMWLGPGAWPVRGWIMQQVTKLSANHAVDTELMMFADSDLELIRPLDETLLLDGGQLRLHRVPGAMSTGKHLQWHHRAARLLGKQPRYFGSDYIGQLITWRRSNLEGLQAHLENVHGTPWYRPVARSVTFSEYILYGAYVEHVMGKARNGHFYCADDICHCCWLAADAARLANGTAVISSRAQAILLQSNLGLRVDQEAALLSRAQQNINPILSNGH
jgi:hypothetical protein